VTDAAVSGTTGADFVALMRGINVGGNRKLPMAELRALCGELSLERPETYIQSGNLIVGANGGAAKLAADLEAAIADRFGLSIPVIVREAAGWKAYIDTNPFAGEVAVLPKMLHLMLAAKPPPADAPDRLAPYAKGGERIRTARDALWIDYGAAVGTSKLTPAVIDRAFGSPATGRNLNTVLRLQAMIEARA